MPTESDHLFDNRAVSAVFRIFGGRGDEGRGGEGQRTSTTGMHLIEFRFLALWIPLSLLVALAHYLTGHWGMVAGWLLAFPLGFLIINLLPIALCGRHPTVQWRLWLSLFVMWAWFHRGAGGITAAFAWAWLFLASLNLVSWGIGVVLSTLGGTGQKAMAWRMFLFLLIHLLIIVCGMAIGWSWAIAAGACVAAMICFAILHPTCPWVGPVTTHTGDDRILITIDDGPDPHDTPKLLDLLDRYQSKAIFFMIGEKVRAYPDLAREVLRRGHEIGNHTLTHPQASFWCAGPSRTRREIAECDLILQQTTGVKPKWFRAPVGHRNGFTHPVARELGLEVMAWSRRGYDAVEKDAAKVLARILPDLAPGDIVLLHEATPIALEVLEGVLRHPALLEHANQLEPPGSAIRQG